MPKYKLSKLEKKIFNDFEKQLQLDAREELQAQKLFEKSFKEKFDKDERNEKRIAKKQKLEKRKINLKTKRKLNSSKLEDRFFYDKNNVKFKSKQQDIFLSQPIIISKQFLENDFINFLFQTFSDGISKFLKYFKKKNSFTFTIGYVFYFEGLSGNKTYAKGFRNKEEMPIDINEILITIQKLFEDIKKRFDDYYTRAGSHILKFKGITLEASPK